MNLYVLVVLSLSGWLSNGIDPHVHSEVSKVGQYHDSNKCEIAAMKLQEGLGPFQYALCKPVTIDDRMR